MLVHTQKFVQVQLQPDLPLLSCLEMLEQLLGDVGRVGYLIHTKDHNTQRTHIQKQAAASIMSIPLQAWHDSCALHSHSPFQPSGQQIVRAGSEVPGCVAPAVPPGTAHESGGEVPY